MIGDGSVAHGPRAPAHIPMALILLNTLFDDPAKKWLAIGVAMFLLAYFVLRPLARRKQDPLEKMSSPGGAGGSMAKHRSVEREMSNLLVELSEMARQVTAQLDTRATKLELLMKDADEKIETLRQLQSSLGATLGAHPSAPPSVTMRHSAAERDALMQPLDAPSMPPPPLSSEHAMDPRYAEIYTLADQGRTPGDIASRLGRPSGEIELILALRQ